MPNAPMPRALPTRHGILLSLAVLSAAPAVHAQQWRERGPERQEQRERVRDDTLSDSVRRIERDTRGQVLSAERIPFDGRDVNRVKVVDDRGRVRVYMDDPHRRGDERRDPPARDDDD